MAEKTNKLMILFVLLVVVLSIIFTWQALDVSNEKSESSENTAAFPETVNQGRVGVNIQSKEENEI